MARCSPLILFTTAALTLFGAADAHADVVITNLATGVTAGSAFGATTSPAYRAFGFTMGGASYTLDEVVLGMNFPSGSQAPLVTLRADAAGAPGTLLETLVTPGGLAGSVDVVFTASGTVQLAANTTYWVQLEAGPTNVGGFRWVGSSPSTTPVGVATAVGYVQPTGTNAAQERLEVRGTPGAGSLGTPYCAPAVVNSTGSPGVLAADGDTSASANDVTLTASDLPQQSFGFFLTSRTQGLIANPGGSQGVLCLGGSIGRYVGPGQIQNSGTTGEISLVLDLTNTPQPAGSVAVLPGETWNFQAWYRDVAGGVPTSNFTSAVAIAFN
jgi:hypothetical protein